MAKVNHAWLTPLSWNVHGLPFRATRERLRRVAACIGGHRPDLVLLQEVWSRAYAHILTSALEPDYHAAFAPRRFASAPRGGLVTLVRRESGWHAGPVWFEHYRTSAPWFRLHEGDGISGKGILAVELRRSTERLVAVNTHLQAQYGDRRYTDIRRAQLAQLAAFLERAGAGSSLLLAGDLNTEAGEELYHSHVAPLGEDLTAEERRLHGGGTCFDRRGAKTEWLDYAILRGPRASASLTRVESDAPDHPYSDHDGLIVRIVSSVSGTAPAGLLPVRG